ncbi:recombination mediator RecR [Thermostichus vulcanus]|uniref:Recombination protein RecR n=1 Tax=Thermostichus vulcanus str. 'Rupite' TaxID=2813851 RepID=A0ABT0CE82_THEVL|nr:recombination mediator RecR [Thermostichus vulcanus]MCJ2544078.1 recombination protein RecR [Thermostichus vulcanus str. 'Rupite']
MYTRPLARLIEELQRLPGIGAKTAQRLALHLINRPVTEIEALAQALLEAKQTVKHCSICFNWSAEDPCEICRSPQRDPSLWCVVAEVKDLIALERTREFKGRYHVLGGLISPMNGIGVDQLHIRELVARVAQEKPRELIFAISPSVEGEVTMHVIKDFLKQVSPTLYMTRLAFGLPMGSELEYADEVTLARALEARREL